MVNSDESEIATSRVNATSHDNLLLFSLGEIGGMRCMAHVNGVLKEDLRTGLSVG